MYGKDLREEAPSKPVPPLLYMFWHGTLRLSAVSCAAGERRALEEEMDAMQYFATYFAKAVTAREDAIKAHASKVHAEEVRTLL